MIERIHNDPLDALPCVNLLLGSNLVRRSLLENASRIDVSAFGVFSHDREVHIVNANIL